MNVKKIIATSATGLMLGGIPLASGTMVVSANEVNTQTETTQQRGLSEHTQATADKYIHFNGTVFVLSDDAKTELVGAEFNQVQAQVKNTNSHLLAFTEDDKLMNNITVVDTNGEQPDLSNNLARRFGKNDVKVYWNFIRVWINARELRTGLQMGLYTAGYYIPVPQLKFACGIAGIATNYISSGIGFDFNFYTLRVTKAWMQ